ncbi:MAG: hypothetical protein KKE76_04960 [Gammaproteobacteria bacterium]|nr:hypothetical protein [Gammaproteobacteria bacterium]
MHSILRVICLGSWQGSDATAWVLADGLEELVGADIEIYRCASPAQMLELIKPDAVVYIIDATPDLPCGQMAEIARDDLRHAPHCSSHGVDLLAALNLLDALGDTPRALHILALGVGTCGVPPEAIADQVLPEVLERFREG